VLFKDVLLEGHVSHDDSSRLNPDDVGLSPELECLVFLALADAQDVRFVQSVNLVFIFPPLRLNSLEMCEFISLPSKRLAWKFSFQFPDEHLGHGSDPPGCPTIFDALTEQAGEFTPKTVTKVDTLVIRDLPASLA
jgi:hypothetical protein